MKTDLSRQVKSKKLIFTRFDISFLENGLELNHGVTYRNEL